MEPLEMITIVGSILGSSLMTIAVLLRQMNHLESKLTAKIEHLDTKIDNLDTKFTKEFRRVAKEFRRVAKEFKRVHRNISGLGERIARLEGHLGVSVGSRRANAKNQPATGGPRPGGSTPADTLDDPSDAQHLQAS